jgi:methyl-accepting chemotaxis protein
MPTNIRAVVARTISVPIILLLALSVGLSLWIVHLIRSEGWVQHTYDVLARISESERLLIDQETGLRAFMLTGENRFLEPYETGRRSFDNSLGVMGSLTADNARQEDRIARIRLRYRNWLREVESEKRQAAVDREALSRQLGFVTQMDARKQDMDAMRATFAALRGEEERLLIGRQRTADRANTALLAVGAPLVILFGVLLFGFLRRQFALIDQMYGEKVAESDRARHAAEAMAAEVREQAAAMEVALLDANRDRDEAIRRLGKSGRE